MSGDNELDEIWARARGALAGVIRSSTVLAEAIIEARVAALRRAAQRDRELAQQAREQARLLQQADAAVWRAAMRPQWWREAGAEDIGRVWRAASTWQHVDARAAAARQVVVERLAERGVQVDPNAQGRPSPEDVAWLSDALDQAAAVHDGGATAAATPPGQGGAVIDGEFRENTPASAARPDAARERAAREERAAVHVRAAWSNERAQAVLGCKAWGALAYQLGQLEDQGHDVEVLLRGVPAFVDRAHTPAAFAFRSIEERLEEAAARDAGRGTATGAAAPRGPASTSDAARGEPTEVEPELVEPPDDAEQWAGSAEDDPFGPPAVIDYESQGRALAAGATPEQVRAAAAAHWTEVGQTARGRGEFNYARYRGTQWADDMSRSPYAMLAAEDATARAAITARLETVDGAGQGEAARGAGAERVAAEVQRAGERDERSTQRRAETQPDTPGQSDRPAHAEAARAQQQAELHADRAATHESRAAQLAAQGFPTSTKEVVTATVEKTQSGAAAAATKAATAQRAAPARQRSRPEPKGR